MASGAAIQIITHRPSDYRPASLAARLAQSWQAEGHDVSVGWREALTGDLGLLHLDLTWIADDDVPANPEGRPFLNGAVRDISKRRFSRLLLSPESDWDGPVIVKTDANYHGTPDRRARGRKPLRARPPLSWIPWHLRRALPSGHYPILANKNAVPAWVWKRPELVVERFIMDRQDGLYVLRNWVFLGERSYVRRLAGTEPMVKGTTAIQRTYDDAPAEAAVALRAALGFDLGKFDYIMQDGEAFVLDCNTTPHIDGFDPEPELIAGLAPAIEDWL